MALRLVTAPASEPVTLAQVWSHLRLDPTGSPLATDEDDYLQDILMPAARLSLEGKDGWLNRALITQTWELVLDSFPDAELRIPLPPLQSVTFIKYIDTAETLIELDSGEYAVDTVSQPGWISPGLNGWPQTLDSINTVVIRFIAGYGTASDVPGPIKIGLLMQVGHLYAHREAVIVGQANPMPMGVQHFLENYRAGGVGVG